MPPTWSILPPADTPILSRVGTLFFKASKPWLDFFNLNTVPMKTLFDRVIKAPLDTVWEVKDTLGKIVGEIRIKENKPWSDFFNSEDEDGGTGALEIVSTSPLPHGVRDIEYIGNIFACGGLEPYTWSIISGSLPAGLSMDSDGAITGTPEEVETATFTAQVVDFEGTTLSREFELSIFSCRREEFEDEFDRSDTTIGLGPNWVLQTAGNTAQANMRISSNRLLITGSISSQMHARALYPDGLYWNDVDETTFSQFVTGKLIAAVGTARSGLCLFLNGTPTQLATFVVGAAQGYELQIAVDAGSIVIINFDDNSAVSGSLGTPAANDVYEFQGDVTPSGCRLRVWQNDVLIGDLTDTASNRVQSAGWPGMGSGNQTVSQTWEYFHCRRER